MFKNRRIMIFGILVMLTLVIVDLFDLTYFIPTVKVSRVNYDFWKTLISILVPMSILLITVYIDKNKRIGEENKRNVGYIYINEIIKNVENGYAVLNKQEILEKIAKKVDFNSHDDENIKNFSEKAFEHITEIKIMAKEGNINLLAFKQLLELWDNWSTYVFVKISFFDHPENDSIITFNEKLKESIQSIKTTMNKQNEDTN